MKIIEIEEAKKQINRYEYAYLQMLSEHVFNRTAMITEVNWDELSEGYFFSEEGQMHVFRDCDVLRAVETTDEDRVLSFVDRKYRLANKYNGIGKNVWVREYFNADDDGQSFIAATRLLKVE